MGNGYEELGEVIIEQIQTGMKIFWAIAIPVFIAATIVVSLVRTFIRYYNLSLWETEQGYKVIAGLFNRREQAVRRRKIQFIKWGINPLQALLKFCTIRLYQASSRETSNKRAISLPGSSQDNVDQLLNQNFSADALKDLTEGRISQIVVWRRFSVYRPWCLLSLHLCYAFPGWVGMYCFYCCGCP